MRDLLKVLGLIAVIVIIAMLVGWVAMAENTADKVVKGNDTSLDAEWEAWEQKAMKVGAGEESPPMPDEDFESIGLTSHQNLCKVIKGWCPTVTNGVIAGKRWCLGKPGSKKKPKCYDSHRNRSYEIMLKWWSWLKMFMGGKHPLYKAGTIRTESEDQWDAMTGSFTKECGLASVDLIKAKKYDINACDAKANLWAAGQMTNLQLIKLREKYPQMIQSPLSDQWKLAGACGAIGANKVHNLIDTSGALRTKDDGTPFYAHPHDRILKWLMWADKNPEYDLYSFDAMILLGRNPGRGSFRVSRSVAQEILFDDIVGGADNLYGEPFLAPRPDDLYPFPGDSKHCKCYLWPELADRKPDPVQSVPGLKDPRVP